MEIIVGIDLGTTNSEVAVIRDQQPHVFAENDDPILPSFVGLSEDGKLLVGKAARNQYVIAPERTIKSIKRKMGQDVKVKLGDQEYRPQEISAMILKALKDRAAAQLGHEVKKAVITVPAYFNDTQRQATREAGSLAGLEVVRILNEPTAASLTYDPSQRDVKRMLVYDLGGGTFDVSIVQAQDGVVEVLASHGDTQLGGDDFDDLLLNLLADRFNAEHGIDLRASLVSRARLLQASEAAKKALSFHPFAKVQEEFIATKDGQQLHLDMEVSREEYETLIRPLLDRTMDCVQKALDDAKVVASAIDKVVLVGGSTRTPLISEMLEERLRQPALQTVNPDLCVAMGAAIQGGLISGQDVGAVLVDITAHTLGIRALSFSLGQLDRNHFARILHRQTPLPSSRSEVFSTVHDDQEAVEVEVFQGEDDDVRRNHMIGNFTIENLAKVPAGNPIVVKLDLSLDGTLLVTATERATGLAKSVKIDNALAKYQREERAEAQEKLEALWEQSGSGGEPAPTPAGAASPGGEPIELVNPTSTGHRETVQAKALIEKAQRLIEKAPGDDKKDLERMVNEVQAALAAKDWAKVNQTSNALAETLFYLEDA